MKNNQTKEKLLAEVERLKKELKEKKEYGLVWDTEREPEEVVEMCKEKLPVLKEVKSKEIISDGKKPVNLLIEGDNYHSLSVLNYTHAKKIDVIYIDPPYNTGARDWKYNNDFVDSEDGFRHSKWINMMDKRLNLAKGLLAEKGIVIIAVDHNELFNLGLLCDKIFGESNRIGVVTVVHKPEGRNQEKFFGTSNEFMFVYAKNIDKAKFNKVVLDSELQGRFDEEDEKGKFRLKNFIRLTDGKYSLRVNKPHFFYPIYVSSDLNDFTLTNKDKYYEVLPITDKGVERTWKTTKETFIKLANSGDIVAKKEGDGIVLYEKLREDQVIKTHWIKKEYHAYHFGTKLLESILGTKKFDFPKSLYLVWDILKLTSKEDAVILDFFAGSGTTGHAVLELNREDGGTRKFILCTNNENKICEDVTYARVKKVIEGYLKNGDGEKVPGLNGNLKYFKTDFVDYKDATDKNKVRLTEEAIEMLCVKEGTFEEIENKASFKIFKNHDHHTGIIFDQLAITEFKKAISSIDGKFSVYVFSLGDDTFDEEFEDIKQKVKLSPIPEGILKVYRKIFK